MDPMWETMFTSFVIVVALGILYFLCRLTRKLISCRTRRRSSDLEMSTMPPTGRQSTPTWRPIVRRPADVIRTTVETVFENNNTTRQGGTTSRASEPSTSAMSSSSTPQRTFRTNRYRNYTYSDTFKSAFEPPKCYDEPPTYESAMNTLKSATGQPQCYEEPPTYQSVMEAAVLLDSRPHPYNIVQNPSTPLLEDSEEESDVNR